MMWPLVLKYFKRVYAAACDHPVEMFLAVVFCVFGFVLFETNHVGLQRVVSYYPVCFLLTYTFGELTGKTRWRAVYYLSALYFLPFFWIRKAPGSDFHLVSLLVVQLLYLAADWRRDNERFARKALGYLKALFSSGVLSGMAWLLSISIYFSIQYLFEIWQGADERFMGYSASVVFLCVFPLLFLVYNREKEWTASNRLLDALFDYVLSPALLLYTAILYLYFLKVAVLWSLPKGGVAYLVIGFVGAVFFLNGCRLFLGKRSYDWFYRRASWVAVPVLAMYWVGASYRIDEYGYTEARVYLVAVGAILTGTALLFFSRRAGRYLYAAVWAMFCLAVVTYVPGMTAKDIERISQTKRGNYPIAKDRGGHRAHEYVTLSTYAPIDITEYETLQAVGDYDEPVNSTVTPTGLFLLRDQDMRLLFRAEKDSLLFRQMEKAGLAPSDSIPESAYPEILRLELDSALYVFGEISLVRSSPDSAYSVSRMGGGYYLKKRVSLPANNK